MTADPTPTSDSWTPGPLDRITADELGIDEIVLTNVTAHLERIDNQRYYLGIYDSGTPDALLVQVDILAAPGRAGNVTAYLTHLEAPDDLPVDPDAWNRADEHSTHPTPVVHLLNRGPITDVTTICCRRTIRDLPDTDHGTTDPHLVTCQGGPP